MSIVRFSRCLAAVATLALACAFSPAQSALPPDKSDVTFEARIRNLESGLRCLVCQNQTLADSNASLAEDLRREVRSLAASGKTDDEIKAYLVARYGDFVLYKPPLQANTAPLWLLPFGLLACGCLLWWTLLRRRTPSPPTAGTREAENQRRGQDLLQDEIPGTPAPPPV